VATGDNKRSGNADKSKQAIHGLVLHGAHRYGLRTEPLDPQSPIRDDGSIEKEVIREQDSQITL